MKEIPKEELSDMLLTWQRSVKDMAKKYDMTMEEYFNLALTQAVNFTVAQMSMFLTHSDMTKLQAVAKLMNEVEEKLDAIDEMRKQ